MKTVLTALVASLLIEQPLRADQTIFDDSLQNGWQDWSWAVSDLNNSTPVHGGSRSIKITADAWEALYFEHPVQNAADYESVRFWLHGGTHGGQRVSLQALTNGVPVLATNLPPLTANSWKEFVIPFKALGLTNQSNFNGFYLQDATGTTQPAFFVDDVTLITRSIVPPGTNTPASIRIDATLGRHPIDPRIYGVAYASTADLKLLNATMNRQGGNNTSRYNWQANADNRAEDYFYLSIPYDIPTPGEHADSFIQSTRAAGAEPSLTIPMLDWVARVGPNREWLWSYSIAKYGPQKAHEPFRPDCGNGVRTDGSLILNNNPADANVAAGPAFQQPWLNHLVQRWGSSADGGVRYYHLDNEPGLWHSSHRDVHPSGATLEEMRNKCIAFATRIKATDAQALVLGPDEWHFAGAIYSGADSQYNATNGFRGVYPDRLAHGNMDVYPYLLREFAQASKEAGRRLLDVCTVHYYPQGGEFGDSVTPAIQQLRNRSTRSLWDPNYIEENWLADNAATRNVRLIPRLKEWVNAYYPGTLIGLTEYNWGAEGHINGATAQADILGILGRESLDIAERWTTPATGSPAFKAFQMYRNYDGAASAFGDVSVGVTNPINPDIVSSFAAQRSSDKALTVMLINKSLSQATNVTLSLTNVSGTTAQIWRLNEANAITRLADVPLVGGTMSLALPEQSITLVVIADNKVRLEMQKGALNLQGGPGQRYLVESSSDLRQWAPWHTNNGAGASLTLAVSMASPRQRFFRTTLIQ